jgi:hypothetical protein
MHIGKTLSSHEEALASSFSAITGGMAHSAPLSAAILFTFLVFDLEPAAHFYIIR